MGDCLFNPPLAGSRILAAFSDRPAWMGADSLFSLYLQSQSPLAISESSQNHSRHPPNACPFDSGPSIDPPVPIAQSESVSRWSRVAEQAILIQRALVTVSSRPDVNGQYERLQQFNGICCGATRAM